MPAKLIQLSKPLKTHKGDLLALELREPTGGDLLDLGQPFSIERKIEGRRSNPDAQSVTVRETIDYDKFRDWLVRLSGLDNGTLSFLPLRDMQAAINWLTNDAFSEAGENPINPSSSS